MLKALTLAMAVDSSSGGCARLCTVNKDGCFRQFIKGLRVGKAIRGDPFQKRRWVRWGRRVRREKRRCGHLIIRRNMCSCL